MNITLIKSSHNASVNKVVLDAFLSLHDFLVLILVPLCLIFLFLIPKLLLRLLLHVVLINHKFLLLSPFFLLFLLFRLSIRIFLIILYILLVTFF